MDSQRKKVLIIEKMTEFQSITAGGSLLVKLNPKAGSPDKIKLYQHFHFTSILKKSFVIAELGFRVFVLTLPKKDLIYAHHFSTSISAVSW